MRGPARIYFASTPEDTHYGGQYLVYPSLSMIFRCSFCPFTNFKTISGHNIYAMKLKIKLFSIMTFNLFEQNHNRILN